jgi:hypothetical protein
MGESLYCTCIHLYVHTQCIFTTGTIHLFILARTDSDSGCDNASQNESEQNLPVYTSSVFYL